MKKTFGPDQKKNKIASRNSDKNSVEESKYDPLKDLIDRMDETESINQKKSSRSNSSNSPSFKFYQNKIPNTLNKR